MTGMGRIRNYLLRKVLIGLGLVCALVSPTLAWAGCHHDGPGYCSTNNATATWWLTENPPFSNNMNNFLLNDIYQDRLVKDWWVTKFKPALEKMAAQIVAAQVQNTGISGTLMDGMAVNRALLATQTLQAKAYHDYTPGEGLCRFGTNMRSLASTDMNRTQIQVALAEISQARQLGTKGTLAASGPILDRRARLDQFTRFYCDPGDNGGLLAPICGSTPNARPTRFNKDISIPRTLLGPLTLNINFADGTTTADEEDILALARNLYGPDVLTRDSELTYRGENAANKLNYLSQRQLIAFRNVAQNSFNVAVASRAGAGKASNTYMENILRELGFSAPEAKTYLSNNTNSPSYNAQMEILTKRIYQNPNFYTNLMDKPANVDRQIAAIEAIGLMQDRDTYQSLERQELLMSLLLEMKTRAAQRLVERDLKAPGAKR